MTNKQTNKPTDCDDPVNASSLHLAEAIEQDVASCTAVGATEQVILTEALGRILAQDLIAPRDVPGFDNSAMDGYAVVSSDLPTSGKKSLSLIGTSMAGTGFNGVVSPGECIRIMTGAMMPAGADTVVMQEHVTLGQNNQIEIDDRHRPQQNVRYADNDIAGGNQVLSAGRCLSPADLGVLASLGIETVDVIRRVRVAFFSSGDEIKTLGDTLGPGEIYNSSRYSIGALIEQTGAQLQNVAVLEDDYAVVKQALLKTAAEVDVIITTGGVSVGDADYIKDAVEEIGEIGFWKLAMKPGRPMAFGRLGNCVFFGLPGNPVSSMATFKQIVAPALHKISGRFPLPNKIRLNAIATSNIKKRPGRIDFQRGILNHTSNGFEVSSTGAQSSGQLSSMSEANCFIVLPLDGGDIKAGDIVLVEPFESTY